MNYLLDTCVISELAAKIPDQNVAQWIDSVTEDRVHLSVITIGEIKKGVERLPDSRRKDVLAAWLENELLVRFKNKLVALDLGVLLTWGSLVARMESSGKKMPAIDSLIAASAIHSGFVLVTRNEADFAETGVTILNPWNS